MNATPGERHERHRCCVVGGGPAGVMLGFLLARAGIEVVVLEKHRDFLRDFRGDTIHPSTLELMQELGFLEEFLRKPHQETRRIQAHFTDEVTTIADFSHLPTRCKFVAFMPQWDFLDFVANQARRYKEFRLIMEAEVTDLMWKRGRVSGVKAMTPEGELHVSASLVVGADGRNSIVRESARLEVLEIGAPIDVLWFRLPKQAKDPSQSLGYIGAGQFMVMLDRDAYWQCAYVIPKGAFKQKKTLGISAFQKDIGRCTPFLRDRTGELKSWEEVKLLSVKVDRLREWFREGLLCIGDCAHAMSPVGGVGINLALQDAVATARILSEKLRADQITIGNLRAVQARRELPTRLTQAMQVFLHKHALEPIFQATTPISPPWPLRLLSLFPVLQRIPARMIGLGFRPEHVK